MSQSSSNTIQARGNYPRFHPKVALWCTYTGYLIFTLGTYATLFWVGFIDPPSPSLSPEALLARVQENQFSILFGCSVLMFVWCLWMFWMAPILMYLRRMEEEPILTFAALVFVGGGLAGIFLTPMLFALSAFRAEDPVVAQTAWDFGMMMFVYSFPPFTFFNFLFGVAILIDINKTPTFPRWFGYLSIFVALGTSPSYLQVFFHDGPFAYNGLVVFWIILIIFFSWMFLTTIVVHRKLKQDIALREADERELREADERELAASIA